MTIRMRVLPRFPARISGTNGIKVTRDGLDLVVQPDYGSLVQAPAINVDSSYFQIWNSDDDSYLRMSFGDALNVAVPIYGTAALVASITPPDGATAFRTNGYGVEGDGLGNFYVSEAGQHAWRETLTTADGRTWWEAGDILRPISVSIPDDFATLNDLLAYLAPRRVRAKLSVAIEAGTHSHSALAIVSHPDAQNIEAIGVHADITISSVGTATGSAWAWDVPLTLADASGVVVDDWIYIAAKITSSNDGSNIEGTWRVLSVAGDVATVRITSVTNAFPAITDTNIPAIVIKSVLQWDSETTGGIYISATTLGLFQYVVFDGQFDVADGVGSDVAGVGLSIVGWPHVILGLDQQYMAALGSGTFYQCALVRWKADGAMVGGGVLDATSSHACSNGWRGFQSGASASSIFAKASVGSGNRKSGIECESSGNLIINNSVGCGNGEAGIYAPFNGVMSATNCRALRNTGAGVDLRYGSQGDLTGTVSRDNTLNGFFLDGKAFCRIDSVVCSGHSDGDLRAQGAGHFRAVSAPTLSSTTPYRTITASPGTFEIAGINGVIGNGLFFNATTGANGGGVITPSSSGDIVFQRRTSGSATSVSSFTMRSASFRPETDNAVDLGESSLRWAVVRAGTGTINTSDQREKQDYEDPIPDEWLDAWGDVKWVRYKWRDVVKTKGDKARWHIGLIAQQVQEAFSARGIDAFDIGLLCYDEWTAEAAETDQDGNVVIPAREVGSRYGIRYDEAEAMEAAYQRRRLNRLEAQIRTSGN